MESSLFMYLNSMRKIIPYNPRLKHFARQLRNNSTTSEIELWKYLKRKQLLGFDFHRQKPIDNYIVDFYCCDLLLAIELDGITHHYEETVARDERKEKRLNELGVTVLRFEDEEVMYFLDTVLEEIEEMVIKLRDKPTP